MVLDEALPRLQKQCVFTRLRVSSFDIWNNLRIYIVLVKLLGVLTTGDNGQVTAVVFNVLG